MSAIKAFHIDAGRKYYSPAQIKDLVEVMAENGYNLLELTVGNDGLRLLLEDMAVATGFGNYESGKVKAALHEGNIAYCDNTTNELSEAEVSELIAYAGERGIDVMPLLNSPGHMDAILTAMERLGIEAPAYKGSATTVDLDNLPAVAFTKELLRKYIAFFASKGCRYFNLGSDEYANDVLASGFASLQNPKDYGYDKFIAYVNEVAGMIKEAGMLPVMFNDGVYYNRDLSAGTLDTDILVSYWSFGWWGYEPAPVDFVEEQGFRVLDTAAQWYYVLGRTEGDGGNQDFTFQSSLRAMKETKSAVAAGMKKKAPVGSMFCLWSDNPTVPYDEKERERLHALLKAFQPNQSVS